ncbi:MAG: hypothetical protein M0Q88_01130 [Bacilli bacterium]|nr:hypothetical protein [Bacilli bacterium]
MSETISRRVQNEFTKIARECLLINTLVTRYSDRLDFYDVSVWGVAEALKRAYELGKADAMKKLDDKEES